MNKQDELRHVYKNDERQGSRPLDSEQIAKDIEAFLAGGGEIVQVPAHMSGEEWEKWEWDKVARYSYHQAQDKKMGAKAPE